MLDIQTEEGTIDPIFVSVKQAAKALNISTWVCYQLLDDENCVLEGRHLGRRRLVVVESIRRFAESLPTERPESA